MREKSRRGRKSNEACAKGSRRIKERISQVSEWIGKEKHTPPFKQIYQKYIENPPILLYDFL